MAALYSLYYYPYSPSSVPGRAIASYLDLQAQLVGAVLALLGESVSVQKTIVSGAFSLSIVKDCSSLDAQALFAAVVLAFPSRPTAKAIGLVAGLLALNAANVLRMVALYFVGARAPSSFDTVHEEVMPLVLIAVALIAFVGWTATLRTAGVEHAASA